MSKRERLKAIADIVHHLDWHGEYKRYYTLRKEYIQYLSEIFPIMRTTNWGGIVELINSNRFFSLCTVLSLMLIWVVYIIVVKECTSDVKRR